MLQVIWDTRGYFFWLLVVSLICWTLERIVPWRSDQKAFRDQFGQDLFWLVFNGHYAGLLLAYVAGWVLQSTRQILEGTPFPSRDSINLLSHSSPWLQFLVFLVVKDLLEWGIHNLLHRIPWLWEFHKLHHSIKELDWDREHAIPLDGNSDLSQPDLSSTRDIRRELHHHSLDRRLYNHHRTSESFKPEAGLGNLSIPAQFATVAHLAS